MKDTPWIHIYAPEPDMRRVRILWCPDCGVKRRTLVRSFDWHPPTFTCLKCGGIKLPKPTAKRREAWSRKWTRERVLERAMAEVKQIREMPK